MNEELSIHFDIAYSKMSYILACLTSYSSLDLSKRLNDINKKVLMIQQSLSTNKDNIDVRDVIELRNQLKELEARIPNSDRQVALQGHKISCLLFELSSLYKLLAIQISNKEDFSEYLKTASIYLYDCGRIINNEMLCYEEYIN